MGDILASRSPLTVGRNTQRLLLVLFVAVAAWLLLALFAQRASADTSDPERPPLPPAQAAVLAPLDAARVGALAVEGPERDGATGPRAVVGGERSEGLHPGHGGTADPVTEASHPSTDNGAPEPPPGTGPAVSAPEPRPGTGPAVSAPEPPPGTRPAVSAPPPTAAALPRGGPAPAQILPAPLTPSHPTPAPPAMGAALESSVGSAHPVVTAVGSTVAPIESTREVAPDVVARAAVEDFAAETTHVDTPGIEQAVSQPVLDDDPAVADQPLAAPASLLPAVPHLDDGPLCPLPATTAQRAVPAAAPAPDNLDQAAAQHSARSPGLLGNPVAPTVPLHPAPTPAPVSPGTSASGGGVSAGGGSHTDEHEPSSAATASGEDVAASSAHIRRIERAAERVVDSAGDPGSTPD